MAMLDFAIKLTLTPADMTEVDVARLRAAGFSDRDVLDIVEVTSYFAYVNRIADGLGVGLEPWIDWEDWERVGENSIEPDG